jgi:Flp pilus assembly protein CpaB
VENIMSSKLFTTRQGTVLLGVIAAVLAAIVLLVYLSNYRNSVNASNDRINVLVAKSLIQKGTSGDVIARSTGMYTVAEIPKKQVQTGAFVDSSTLAGKVAVTDINPNSQLTAADFGPAGSSIANNLDPGQRAVVVSLGSPQSVGGQITAGSHVDVYVSSSAQSSTGVTRPTVKLLFQNMYVLNAGTSGGNVTVRATPTQAGQLIYASQNTTIYLTLRPTVGTNVKTPPIITARNVTGG